MFSLQNGDDCFYYGSVKAIYGTKCKFMKHTGHMEAWIQAEDASMYKVKIVDLQPAVYTHESNYK